ncbi:MAG: TIGR03560 family F420-dependent LLM class oxidoreductase [Candidatus Bathyarchaeia archaeon]
MANKFGAFVPFYAFKNQQPNITSLFSRLQQTVKECEQLGYQSAWLDDHLMINKTQTLECWTTLAALSNATTKIRLGTMITCNTFRNPSLLAKMAATVDGISNGRLELGIGAGIQQNEHQAYGVAFPCPMIRIQQMDEALDVMKLLWTQETASYSGKHYSLHNAICEPKPLQKPYPPITVGGAGEQLTLGVTAKHANRFDWGYLPSKKEYLHKLQVLTKHCNDVGRDVDEIEKSCWPFGQIFLGKNKNELNKLVPNWLPKGVELKEFMQTNFVGTPEDCIKQIQEYVDVGVTYFMLYFGDFPSLRGLKLFAQTVLPNF